MVYGHDETARDQLESLLRRWDIEPLIMDQLPSEGMTIVEKLERYRNQVRFAVVLVTPDDEGHRRGHPDEKMFRARQNVVLELGMMLATVGREYVFILMKQNSVQIERPSDIQGLLYIPFHDHVKEAAGPLAKEFAQKGVDIDVTKL